MKTLRERISEEIAECVPGSSNNDWVCDYVVKLVRDMITDAYKSGAGDLEPPSNLEVDSYVNWAIDQHEDWLDWTKKGPR